jgi:hypothetical protein
MIALIHTGGHTSKDFHKVVPVIVIIKIYIINIQTLYRFVLEGTGLEIESTTDHRQLPMKEAATNFTNAFIHARLKILVHL